MNGKAHSWQHLKMELDRGTVCVGRGTGWVCVQLKERRRHHEHMKIGSVHGGPQIPWKHPFLLSWEKGDLLASLCYPVKYHPPPPPNWRQSLYPRQTGGTVGRQQSPHPLCCSEDATLDAQKEPWVSGHPACELTGWQYSWGSLSPLWLGMA